MNDHAFHNTTNEGGQRLQRYQDKALSQDQRLLAYFNAAYEDERHYVLLTPTLALIVVFANKIPITSVRRALSNLTRDGHLMTAGKTKGPYGRPEHYWRLVPQSRQQMLPF